MLDITYVWVWSGGFAHLAFVIDVSLGDERGRDAALRTSWSAAIAMTAPMRMSSSGSPGKLAAGGGRCPVPDATPYVYKETSKYFPESGNLSIWRAGPS